MSIKYHILAVDDEPFNLDLIEAAFFDYDNIEILEGVEEGQEVITGPVVVISKRLEGGELIKVPEGDKGEENKEEPGE